MNPGVQKPHLEAVVVSERGLQGMQLPAGPSQAFDRRDLAPFGLHCEHQARAHRFAVQATRCRPRTRRARTDVRARQLQILAEEVNQGPPGLDETLPLHPVDRDLDRPASAHGPGAWSSNGFGVM